jgi:hypothetical protein
MEGFRMSSSTPTDADVGRLLSEASKAKTLEESRRLVMAAEEAKSQIREATVEDQSLELGHTVASEHLTPAPVFEHHTAATDWIGEVDTGTDEGMDHKIAAEASLWYGNLHEAVKANPTEFAEQATGKARKLAGSYGAQAEAAESTFLDAVGTFHSRDVKLGAIQPVDDGTGAVYEGLPGEATTSERARNIQGVENNTGPGPTDVVPVNDPGEGQVDTQVDRENGDLGSEQVADLTGHVGVRTTAADDGVTWRRSRTWGDEGAGVPFEEHPTSFFESEPQNGWHREFDPNGIHIHVREPSGGHRRYDKHINGSPAKEASMAHAQCPTCGGHGRVAVRQAPQRKQAYSGLPQIDQIINPSGTGTEETPYPPEVAFPWQMNPNATQQQIEETEQQIQQRNQERQNVSGRTPQQQATAAAHEAYRRVMAGYDASGWAGDMGQGGYGPSMQDQRYPGPAENLGYPDPVFGFGGDQQQKPLKPYGGEEADDETNNPSTWAPGQPTQMDMAGASYPSGAPAGGGGPAIPNQAIPNGAPYGGGGGQKQSSRIEGDPQLQSLLDAARNRRAYLQGRG